MSKINILLSRLDKVRLSGNGTYAARCPAHDDKNPSLSIRELDDGRILIHDHAGCDVYSVLDAIGLNISDLYPDKLTDHHVKREKYPFPAADILRAISFEMIVVSIAVTSMLSGEPLNAVDRARLELAISRIQAAIHTGGLL